MSRYLKILSVLAMLVAMGGLNLGCETTEGMGRDLEDAGDEIEDAVD
jgi:predicted small secreted protein